jgi:hypothetical protein
MMKMKSSRMTCALLVTADDMHLNGVVCDIKPEKSVSRHLCDKAATAGESLTGDEIGSLDLRRKLS